MKLSTNFCTCKNTKCPRHPSNHDQGCAPCVERKLQTNGIPACFFNKLEGGENKKGDSFEDFANFVHQK